MKKQYLSLYLLLSLSVSSCFLSFVFADEIETTEAFSLAFSNGEVFQVQDIDHDTILTFDIQSGNLTGTAELTVSDTEGTLEITPTASGLIYVTANIGEIWITINDITHTGPYNYNSGISFSVGWSWTSSPVLPTPIETWPIGGDISLLLTYLQTGDLIGFIMACYVTKLGQVFYAILALLLTVPLAIRTQSVVYVAVVWLVLAGVFQAAVPLIAPASVLLTILAIAALLYKAYARE
jgi:hypothetical protein